MTKGDTAAARAGDDSGIRQPDEVLLLRRLADISFRSAPRGYDKGQVDQVLANLASLADEVADLHREVRLREKAARLYQDLASAKGIDPGPVGAPDDRPRPLADKVTLLRRVTDISFKPAWRGYDKAEVDRVLADLAPVADTIEALQARIGAAHAGVIHYSEALLANGVDIPPLPNSLT